MRSTTKWILVAGLAGACNEGNESASTAGTGDVGTGDAGTDDPTSAGSVAEGGPEPGPGTNDPATSMGADGTGGDDLWPAPSPGDDVTLTLFEGRHLYYLGESENLREVDLEVEFPGADAGYSAVTLDLGVRCPDGGCDHWDRYGSLAVVEAPGTDDERIIEIARFVTPYRVAADWSFDLSHLRPLLTGPQALRLTIDTWVGPGHPEGAGWLVDASIAMTGGVASPRPVAVVPIYTRRAYELGNPDLPVGSAVPPVTVPIPAGTTGATLVSLITGHGQGNAENCAEFCQDNHGYLLGGATAVMQTVWRNDCDETPVPGQLGNWSQARAGWCPGAQVLPWIEEVGEAADPGAQLSLEYAVSPYENTCRPGLDECLGCAPFTTCEYDGSNHTEPRVRISTLLVGWVD